MFKEDLIKEVFRSFFGDRISQVAACGSIVNGRSNASSDLDLLLVLKDHSDEDLVLCRKVAQRLSSEYKIDLSLQYLDELPANAADFQDGAKGCLALTYISSAHFLIGENIFKAMFSSLAKEDLQRSAIKSVGDYLHQMYGELFESPEDTDVLRTRAFKYLCRSIIDSFIYYAPTDMEPYKKLDKAAVLQRGIADDKIGHIVKNISITSPVILMVKAIENIHRQLWQDLSPQ